LQKLGTGAGNLKYHICTLQREIGVAAVVPLKKMLDIIIGASDKTIQ
jgi:hypothetical protein